MSYDLSFLYDYIERNDKTRNHDFFNTVISQLSIIYGTDNIKKAAQKRNVNDFKTILKTYNYPESEIETFFLKIFTIFTKYKNQYYEKSNFFIEIEKQIIDMMVFKINATKVDDNEIIHFENTLYSKYNPNLICRIFNLLFNKNDDSIYNYWLTKKEIDFDNVDVEFLPNIKYEQFGLSLDEVKKMAPRKIKNLNEQIVLMAKDDETNNGGRTQNITQDNQKRLVLTSGNAIVDAILLMGFIATQLFIGLLIFLKLG